MNARLKNRLSAWERNDKDRKLEEPLDLEPELDTRLASAISMRYPQMEAIKMKDQLRLRKRRGKGDVDYG